MWPLFLHCLDSRAVFVREAMGLSTPINSRVIEWGNKQVHCKSDLPLMAKPTGHTWIRVSDPSCPVIKLTRAAQTSLAWLAPRIAAIPTTPLSMPPILSSLARADAMAEGDRVGIGGWVSTKHSLAWFAEAYAGLHHGRDQSLLALPHQRCSEVYRMLRNSCPTRPCHDGASPPWTFAPKPLPAYRE